MSIYVGIISMGRPRILDLCLYSLIRTNVIKGIILCIDVTNKNEKEHYVKIIKNLKNHKVRIFFEINEERRGSALARNKILNIAKNHLTNNDILIMYDDDYICPKKDSLISPLKWLKNRNIGIVGGRIINLRHRKIDPDIQLNIFPNLADTLTKLTGFIFLDTKNGPRYVEYTSPLMAMRIDVIKKGIRYDPIYMGTGYREESDFQEQVRALNYNIIFDPNFYVYHLCLEYGGNRVVNDLAYRFYWKARNNSYFLLKFRKTLYKLYLSNALVTAYALLFGYKPFIKALQGIKDGVFINLNGM